MRSIGLSKSDQKYIQNTLRSFILLVMFILMFMSADTFLTDVATGEEKIIIRIGVYENKPKIFTDSNGDATGFWPDLMTNIASKENWNIEYIHGSWNEGLERLLDGKIDIMPDVAFTEKRNKIYDFSKNSILTSWSRLYVKKGYTGIESITDLKNKKIAVLKGSVNFKGTGGIKEIVQKFNINCTFLELDSYDKVFEAIDNNLVDAGVTNRNFGNKNEKKFNVKKTAVIFQPVNIKFAFTKNSSSIHNFPKRIDHHIEQLLEDNNSSYYLLLEKYFETEIAEKIVEVFPMWIKTLLQTLGLLLSFSFFVVFISRIQVKKKIREIEIKNEELRTSHERFLTVLDGIDATVYVADMETYEILFMNKNMIESFGRDMTGEICWEAFRNAFEPCPHCTNEQLINENGKPSGVCVWQCNNPITEKWYINYDRAIEWTDQRLVRLQIATDITDFKRSEEEKIKAQKIAGEHKKLALIGQIAGKMAHDFNNILGIIMGNAELSLIDCKDAEIKKTLALIHEQTIRGKNLTRDLVAFAKGQEPKQEFFSINKKINLVLNLLKKDLVGVELINDNKPEIPDLLADSGMIEHALVNLVQNSIHATSKVEYPRIILRTYCTGDNICFEIEDNGCGIPKKYLEDIYEPSFTLKGSNDITGLYKIGIRGTGYGMSNVKKYIEQHKGTISVESEFSSGTKFTISLPVIKKKLTSEEKEEIRKEKIHYDKNILLVEDETPISDIQYWILTHEPCNHKVDIATNGQAAIDLFDRNGYDLISLDYVLPGQFNGMDVYHYIRKINKYIPILFISGNINFLESVKELKQKDDNIDYLSKPCKNKDYVHSINELFERTLSMQQ